MKSTMFVPLIVYLICCLTGYNFGVQASIVVSNIEEVHTNVNLFINEGFALENLAFWVAKAKDIVECAQLCVRRSRCKSFNYDTGKGTCELNSDVKGGGMAVRSGRHLVYSEISVWPSQMDPCCYDKPCMDEDVCMSNLQAITGGNTCTYTCFKAKCEEGWEMFNNHCYYFGTNDVEYESARQTCVAVGSTLVQIDSVTESNFLKNTMRSVPLDGNQGYWNDLYEVTENGTEVRWRTTNDTLNPEDWATNQPDEQSLVQRCTVFFKHHDYSWVDVECVKRLFRPLCERA